MLVIFETLEKELLKVDLEHVPSKGEAVTVFDTVYQVDNVMYETTIRIKPSGKRGVKQIATCEISPTELEQQIENWKRLGGGKHEKEQMEGK